MNQKAYANGDTISYNYEPAGKTSTIYQSKLGDVIQYLYDFAGLMASVLGVNEERAYHMYNESGKIKKSFIGDATYGLSTYHEYNDEGNLIRYRIEEANQTILDETLQYDANGNREFVTNFTGDRTVYEYDPSNRLVREYRSNENNTVEYDYGYVYEGIDGVMNNRTSKTNFTWTMHQYAYNAANEITYTDGVRFQYDANGNLISDGTRIFSYNAKNQLVNVTDNNGLPIASFEYDHQGFRTKKMTPTKVENYFYNVGYLSYITDGQNNLTFSFTRTATGTPICVNDHRNNTVETYFYIRNSHGDVIQLRNNSGSVVASYEYDAFGVLLSPSGSGIARENPLRYAGYFYDEETELYYLNARYYAPRLARFLTRDPLPSSNLYVYCGNNPVMLVDYYGNRPVAQGLSDSEAMQI
ncbi:RHS repeat domain-containing protein [Bacillus fonticola]|uniref:RHS repeat domain-containing protein n=1 Tax=Bacillus fonticola TaxID=2728853 RepID=UPI00147664C5|nr:RHS repeat-associated core domain-containing protein [Bacillus fonticola]